MYTTFFEKFNEKVPLSKTEEAEIATYLTYKKLRKKQFLLQADDLCKAFAYVEKGALRAYSVDNDGVEHIIQFAIEGWLISDMYSFLTQEPSVYNIEAIENAELVLISKSANDEMLKKCPKYEKWWRMNLSGAYIAMQRRLTNMIGSTVEERYTSFIKSYPQLVQRFPQHMIASYIGLTPETLSRIRKRTNSTK